MSNKYVYMFKEGDKSMKNLLGGKGSNLAEMTNLGLPIPQGFIVSTETCTKYYEDNETLNDDIIAQIDAAIANLEVIEGKEFGSVNNPLLVSVRSGARASMPGMMDTVLNLGLNDAVVESIAKATNNPRFAYDSYRRFIMMFSDVVKGVPKHDFERIFDEYKEARGFTNDLQLSAENLKEVSELFKAFYVKHEGSEFPTEAREQLLESIKAVFRSWNNERAVVYRRMHDIPASWGTAVNVQTMVYGNMGDTSGTGVAFTRNPSTGEKLIYGEYLLNAQGEDVVAGVRTPEPISRLEQDMPEAYAEFMRLANLLEDYFKDMQDMEFTIENKKLYFLQTRNGKRTAQAALQIAVDLVDEGKITKEEALLKVDPKQLDQLLHPAFDVKALAEAKVYGNGLPASPGAAAGQVYFNADDAVAAKKRGERVVLVRLETSPEDIEGMDAAEGILTVRGGMTSHAAVVARGMGTCCICGCGDIKIAADSKSFTLGGKTIKEGEYISLNGTTGNIYLEDIKTVEPEISGNFKRFMTWVDEVRTMKVRANADSPKDVINAVEFGAEGVGLCRTEHMFFEETRISKMRQMIVAKTVEEREAALLDLLPFQKEDFKGMYLALEHRPMTVRLLDPPLHEFLPHSEADIRDLAAEMGITFEALKATVDSLHEFNPMLGHRGLRLAVTYPEIARMQTRAIIEAALEVKAEKGFDIVPEIMIPLACEVKEFAYVKKEIVKTADAIIAASGVALEYKVGTMIEIPRAALTADAIAKEAEFFSFGTNDLTQMTFGFSRDDAGSFLDDYYKKSILESDPFARLDQTGVGQLVQMACEKGRKTRPDIKLGICGEHGGDPSSVEFCYNVGLDYVSCSPFRVPIARLAAAQAVLNKK